MKKELKDELKNFLYELDIAWKAEELDTVYFEKWTASLLDRISRKRGRAKGSKYPRKTQKMDNGFIDSPMLGRQLDISMLTE